MRALSLIDSNVRRRAAFRVAAAAVLLGISAVGTVDSGQSSTSAQNAAQAAVLITDSGFRPRVVRIGLRGRVTWTNRGERAHVVTSLSRAFRAFALGPGAAKTVTFARKGSHPFFVDTQCGVVLVGGARGKCPAIATGGTRNLGYRAVAALSVNERFPTITNPCASSGFRQIEWTASVPSLELVKRPQAFLWAKKRGSGRFAKFESRVISPCPGAFHNRFGGMAFQLDITWEQSDNTLTVSTYTPGLDEGEGGGWSYTGCTEAPTEPSAEGVLVGEAPDSPKYTKAETKLTTAERRALLAHKQVRIRRALATTYACSGFGGEGGFDIKVGLDVRLIPKRG